MAEVHYFISDASKQVDVESHVLRYWEDELELEVPRNDMGHRYYTEYHIRLFRQIKELKEKGYQLKAIKNALNKMAGAMGEITITEDYMEEDMKAAWNEGPMRERAGKGGSKEEKAAVGQAGEVRRENVKDNSTKKAADTGKTEPPKVKKEEKREENRDVREPVSQQKPADMQKAQQKSVANPLQTGRRDGEVVAHKAETAELNAEKMARFQSVMNHIIGRAMDANIDRLAREVSDTVSEDVTDKVMKEVEYLMRVSDEKEEERFKQLDETIRAYQRQGKGRAEAAATKVPFFKKKKFGKSGKKLF
ncbi:MAG: MerR family transcriptional regulator [Hungatella sp.]|nr:MerR family transcriptional regulator [Hungatella sp.]